LLLDVDNIIVDEGQGGLRTIIDILSANVSGTGQFVYVKTPVDSIPESTMMSGGRAFKIEARGGITITKWITVTTYFDAQALSGSGTLDLGTLELYKYKNGAWMKASDTCAGTFRMDSQIDKVAGTIVTRVCSLSQFALFGTEAVDKVSKIYLPIIMK
jgi:hypothetical protein